MHALIIEDDALVALAIEEVLRDCGFKSFDVAASLDEAVTSARKRCPELITADVEARFGDRRSPDYLFWQSDTCRLHYRPSRRCAGADAPPPSPEQTFPHQ